LATRDRRWVAWTPEGYFDASAGADRLVGWTVNRIGEPVADHFSLNRFRERFNRPDLIDEVLRTATPVAALDPSIVTRMARTPAQGLQFPPVVSPINLGTVEVADSQLKVPVEVRADHQVRLEVRVDGRPVEADIAPSPAAGGTAALASL